MFTVSTSPLRPFLTSSRLRNKTRIDALEDSVEDSIEIHCCPPVCLYVSNTLTVRVVFWKP
jgi:hypothetical protein